MIGRNPICASMSAGKQAARAGADDDGARNRAIGRMRHEPVVHIGRDRQIAVARQSPQQRGFVPDLDVERIGQHDRRALAGVGGAAEHRVADEIVRPELQPLEDRRFDLVLRVVERQLQFGQAQHGFDLCGVMNAEIREPGR